MKQEIKLNNTYSFIRESIARSACLVLFATFSDSPTLCRYTPACPFFIITPNPPGLARGTDL